MGECSNCDRLENENRAIIEGLYELREKYNRLLDASRRFALKFRGCGSDEANELWATIREGNPSSERKTDEGDHRGRT